MTRPHSVPGDATGPAGFADYVDGRTAILHRVSLEIAEDAAGPALVLTPPGGDPVHWPCGALRRLPDQARPEDLVLVPSGAAAARLFVRDPDLIRAILTCARNLDRRAPRRGIARLAAWAGAAAAAVAVIIFVLVPVMADQLADYLPPEGEQALGDATFRQIRAALDDTGMGLLPICDNPPGLAALDAMRARLTDPLDLPYPVRVHVLDHGMVNAFALPGGNIAIFRGLIDAAGGPDQVASVFAHEIGHVVNRDPTRSALRSAGSIGVLGLLFGDFAGGAVVLFLTERLIEVTYSQRAESAADDFAHDLLARSGILPSSLADMFARLRAMSGDDPGLIRHFTSHPALGDRIAAARAADAAMTGVLRPSLGDADWHALRRICD